MAGKIEDIEGIGEKTGKILREANITTPDKLLEAACSKKGRQGLAEKTGLSEKNLLKWTNLADLCRVNGVSTQYSELLEAAGVDTVKELATRNAENLAIKMHEINQDKKLVRQTPSEKSVSDWVIQAKTLPAYISH